MCTMHMKCPRRSEEGTRGPRTSFNRLSWTTMWVLGTQVLCKGNKFS